MLNNVMSSLNHPSHVTRCFTNHGELCFAASLDRIFNNLLHRSTPTPHPFARRQFVPFREKETRKNAAAAADVLFFYPIPFLGIVIFSSF